MRQDKSQDSHNINQKITKDVLVVVIIFFIGFFLRFYKIESIPPGLHLDEGMYGLCALDIIEGKERPAYFDRVWGVDALFAYIAAILFKLFGSSVWSLRLVSVLTGTLTILGTFLLARELFNPAVALFASGLLAISRWHIGISRLATQSVLVPFLITFSFYWFFKGVRSKKMIDFVISGSLLGLGFYSYLAFRLVPLVFLGTLLFITLEKRIDLRQYSKLLCAGVITTVLVSLPLWVYFLRNPELFSSRAKEVAALNPTEFISNVPKVALMFGIKGDMEARQNIPGKPIMSFPIFLCFILGIAISIWRSFSVKEKRFEIIFLYLLFLIMLLPSILSKDAPNVLRSSGSIPAAYIFAAIFLSYVYYRWHGIISRIIRFLVLTILMGVGYYEFNLYFNVWAKSREVVSGFYGLFYTDVLEKLRELSKQEVIFLPLYHFTLPSITFLVRTQQLNFRCLYNMESLEIARVQKQNATFLLSSRTPYYRNVFMLVKLLYPTGKTIYKLESEKHVTYEIYTVENQDLHRSFSAQDISIFQEIMDQMLLECNKTPWLKDQVSFAIGRGKS